MYVSVSCGDGTYFLLLITCKFLVYNACLILVHDCFLGYLTTLFQPLSFLKVECDGTFINCEEVGIWKEAVVGSFPEFAWTQEGTNT